ncbi:unknown protein [Parachlamydia acanthamoebae UV-7]|uniref:Uncharacterized protein n=1 Tax=Parachlamydia acanthamoebae (strain UV7) TaxID=765952 RepID=F8KZE1_PARAV|nr:unknown protein [Parachlamydia acanthamoebae UV-7]
MELASSKQSFNNGRLEKLVSQYNCGISPVDKKTFPL